MAEYELAAAPRSETGKGPARRARAAGRVPAVLYGHGVTPRLLSVDARELGHALHTDAGANVLIDLRFDRKRQLVLAKQVQRHPVRGTLTHIDFIAVRRGEKVTVAVPVHLVGEAPGVVAGGLLQQELHQVHLEAEVTHVPSAVEADVSKLELGDALRVEDLVVPAGAVFTDAPDQVVVIVATPAAERAAEAEEAEAAEGAPLEGGEAAGAEPGAEQAQGAQRGE